MSLPDEKSSTSRIVIAPDPNATFRVSGTVWRLDGTPLAGATVAAADRAFRREQALAQGTTDPQGHFEITYSARQLARPERGSADLIVRVFVPGQQGPVYTSATFFHASQELTVNFGTARTTSAFERLTGVLQPALGALLGKDLTDDDVAFLTADLGEDPSRVAAWARAARLAEGTGLGAELFYGFAEKGIPADDLDRLAGAGWTSLSRALAQAATDGTIPQKTPEEQAAILERLKVVLVQNALREPAANQPATSLGSILKTSRLGRPAQERLVARWMESRGRTDAVLTALASDPEFSDPAQLAEARFALRAGALTRNHAPLVAQLQRMLHDGSIHSEQDLVDLDQGAWLGLIRRQVNGQVAGVPQGIPGTNDDEKASNYATLLENGFRAAFPSAAVVSRLRKGSAGAGPNGPGSVFCEQPRLRSRDHPARRVFAEERPGRPRRGARPCGHGPPVGRAATGLPHHATVRADAHPIERQPAFSPGHRTHGTEQLSGPLRRGIGGSIDGTAGLRKRHNHRRLSARLGVGVQHCLPTANSSGG
jgi:hypothetical protein